MLIEQYIESFNNDYNVEIPEPTNEGYDFEFGGFETVIGFSEASLHAINIKDIVEQVKVCNALNESAIEEADMLLEASIKGFFEAIANGIKKFWAKVQEVFKTAALKLDRIFNEKGFITRAKQILSTAKFNGKKVTVNGYIYTLDAIDPLKIGQNMKGKVDEIFNGINIPTGENPDFTSAKESIAKTKSSETMDEIAKASKIAGVNKQSDFKTEVPKVLRNGASEKTDIKFDPSTAVKFLDTFTSIKNTVLKQKNDVDSLFKIAISNVKKLQSECDKEKDNTAAVKIEKYKNNALVLNKTLNMAVSVASMKLSALKEEKSQSKSLIVKAISLIKKGKYDKGSDGDSNNEIVPSGSGSGWRSRSNGGSSTARSNGGSSTARSNGGSSTARLNGKNSSPRLYAPGMYAPGMYAPGLPQNNSVEYDSILDNLM